VSSAGFSLALAEQVAFIEDRTIDRFNRVLYVDDAPDRVRHVLAINAVAVGENFGVRAAQLYENPARISRVFLMLLGPWGISLGVFVPETRWLGLG
jgi:hypothetical protein